MKIVINKCYGGFGLSYEAVMLYAKLKGITIYASVNDRKADGSLNFDKQVPYVHDDTKEPFMVHYHTQPLSEDSDINKGYFSPSDIERNDPVLVEVVETLGDEKASGSCGDLHIAEIPEGVDWQIGEYDGMEWVEEKHRTWG